MQGWVDSIFAGMLAGACRIVTSVVGITRGCPSLQAPLRVPSAAADRISCYRDPQQRLASRRVVLRIRHPLSVHLPQQTTSLIRLHELPCIHLMPAWHADCDSPQQLALQRDVLRIRHPLRVHLPQQMVSLIVRHPELSGIYALCQRGMQISTCRSG